MMKFRYDEVADAAYIELESTRRWGMVARSHIVDIEFDQGAVVMDLGHEGRLVGIEILGASRVLPSELTDGTGHHGDRVGLAGSGGSHTTNRTGTSTSSRPTPPPSAHDAMLELQFYANRALWGHVTPALRGVAVSCVGESRRVRLTYEGPVDPVSAECASLVETEMLADYPYGNLQFTVEETGVADLVQLRDGERWAFLRYERDPRLEL